MTYADEIEEDDFYLKGFDYYHNCEDDLKEEPLCHNVTDKFTIASTHAFISIQPFHPRVLHTLARNITTNYDLVLCSHFHTVFDETLNGTRFLNLGAWGRLSVTEAKHEPRVAILDTKTREIEIIKLFARISLPFNLGGASPWIFSFFYYGAIVAMIYSFQKKLRHEKIR